MKKIKLILWGGLIAMTALWFYSDTFISSPFNFGKLKHSLMQYSGVIAMFAMSLAMILASRPKFLEPILGGLDKGYRLHKWLGITALVFAVSHWGIDQFLADIMGFHRPKGARPPMPTDLSWFESLTKTLRHPAKDLGEKAFYVAVVLIAMALIKRIRYRIFAKTHIIMAVAYLVLVFHSVILIKIDYWTQPVGIIMAILMAFGTISAIKLLFKKAGKKHQYDARVANVTHYPEMDSVELSVDVEGWKGHKAGQFAFLKFDDGEPHHPFTISSHWNGANKNLTFLIKNLGDYTSTLSSELTEGDYVMIEGPYGNFTFNQRKDQQQIWIAGGVGVTPFLARMEQLAQNPQTQPIDFFYSASKLDDELKAKLEQLANQANINFHCIVSPEPRLTGDAIIEQVENWKKASVWFCGPAGMGDSIKSALKDNGLGAGKFHQELFVMR